MLGSKAGGGSRPNRHGAGTLSGYQGDLNRAGSREVVKTGSQSVLFELCCVGCIRNLSGETET